MNKYALIFGEKNSEKKVRFFLLNPRRKKRRRKKLKNQGLVASALVEIITVEKIPFLPSLVLSSFNSCPLVLYDDEIQNI